ncbi:MAG: squalene/phytoene synthase family protein [Deltaproteobacteria bacterium]|nr:squalene/phytoene synthase family protein [Deltaproteobacteria bacterium]
MQNEAGDFEICKEYLNKVSRTFALNIQVLKGSAYKSLLLAYLLCRIADTIEDDARLPVDLKCDKLRQYSDLFPPGQDYAQKILILLEDLHFSQRNNDSDLVADAERVFNEFIKLPSPLISSVSAHVKEMALGMADLLAEKREGKIIFLETREELDSYCYFVAGTIGLMITEIFAEASGRINDATKAKLLKRSVAFGLGLQITNIAKDFFGDCERGWCYVPRSLFVAEGIDPMEGNFHDNREAYTRVHKQLIQWGLHYLDEALQYTLDIPRSLVRYRLFCAWPLFMALETLAKLCGEERLFTGQIIKINRYDVKRIVRSTSIAVMSNSALQILYSRVRNRIN